MGKPDQFVKRTFAAETASVTGGAVAWQDPPEIGLTSVQGDGLLLVARPELLSKLSPPWSEAQGHEEILLEAKMPGDHVSPYAHERALLRRQARQVQRMEATEKDKPPWVGQEPLWLLAPHVPGWLSESDKLVRIAPGCHRVAPNGWCPYVLWIAANELPLKDELVPFLVARSGRALEELVRWILTRRPVAWVLEMVKCTAMMTAVSKEWIDRFVQTDDPEDEKRLHALLHMLLDAVPGVGQGLIEKGRLAEARAALRRVLVQRQLELTPSDDTRIEACTDLPTLERWHSQAVTAPTAAEALSS